jgi:hypothetical protein
LLQQFQIAWYRNKAVGNGLLFYSQAAWRPTSSEVCGEIKLGAGYHYAFRPTTSFRQTQTGWQSVGRKGKGMLSIPLGVSIGYNRSSFNTYVSPFIGYQCLAMIGYNKSIPLLPETLLQVGSRIHLEN